jgi:hypothetical protein
LPWLHPHLYFYLPIPLCVCHSVSFLVQPWAVPSQLTAIVVQGGKLGSLVAAASTVASSHAQLVPRGLSQLSQKHLCRAVGSETLPGPCPFGPVLQYDGSDGAAPVVPALQVKPSMCGVDVSEEVLVFAEGGLWGARGKKERLESLSRDGAYLSYCTSWELFP